MCIILLSEEISLLLYSIWWNLGTLRLFRMPIKHWTQTSVCGVESQLYKQISAFIYQNLRKSSKNWVVFIRKKSTWKVNKVRVLARQIEINRFISCHACAKCAPSCLPCWFFINTHDSIFGRFSLASVKNCLYHCGVYGRT